MLALHAYSPAERLDIRIQVVEHGNAYCPASECRCRLMVELKEELEGPVVVVAMCPGCGALATQF